MAQRLGRIPDADLHLASFIACQGVRSLTGGNSNRRPRAVVSKKRPVADDVWAGLQLAPQRKGIKLCIRPSTNQKRCECEAYEFSFHHTIRQLAAQSSF